VSHADKAMENAIRLNELARQKALQRETEEFARELAKTKATQIMYNREKA
jgi:hypothetical protein